jgi:hypothetical protein
MKLTGKSRSELVQFFTPSCPTPLQQAVAENFVDLCAERGVTDTNQPSTAEWMDLTGEAQRRAEAKNP